MDGVGLSRRRPWGEDISAEDQCNLRALTLAYFALFKFPGQPRAGICTCAATHQGVFRLAFACFKICAHWDFRPPIYVSPALHSWQPLQSPRSPFAPASIHALVAALQPRLCPCTCPTSVLAFAHCPQPLYSPPLLHRTFRYCLATSLFALFPCSFTCACPGTVPAFGICTLHGKYCQGRKDT